MANKNKGKIHNNKIILITGGSSGIGKASALQLASEGAEIILQARSEDKLQEAAEEVAALGGKVHHYATDLTDSKAVEKSARKILAEVGTPDVIVHCAGSGEWLSLKEASLSHFETTMASPYLATAFTCKAFYEALLNKGKGHFIMINSPACFFTFPGAIGYMAARWAMLGLAQSLQADLRDTSVAVSTIVFGKVDSPYFENNPVSEERIPRIMGLIMPVLKTDYCGRVISKAVNSQKALVIKPMMLDICVRLNRLFPGLMRWVIRVTS